MSDRKLSVAEQRRLMSAEERKTLRETVWSLQRSRYLAADPSVRQALDQAIQLEKDAQWLRTYAEGLEPLEAALVKEYGR